MKPGENAELNALRLRRLKELVQSWKDQGKVHREFEIAAGLSAGYLSQLLTGRKNFGEVLARRVERNLNLSAHWFDREGDTGPAFKWPFTLSSLSRLERLKPEQVVMIDQVMDTQISGFERENSPRKKPGGKGPSGGSGGSSGGASGGSSGGVTGLPGGTTKHAPFTLVKLNPEQQQVADELARQRAKKPAETPKLRPVDPSKPSSRDLFEK